MKFSCRRSGRGESEECGVTLGRVESDQVGVSGHFLVGDEFSSENDEVSKVCGNSGVEGLRKK